PVAHGGEQVGELGVVLKHAFERTHRVRAGIHQGRLQVAGGDHARTVGHAAVGERGTILHHQRPLAPYSVRVLDGDGRFGHHHRGRGVDGFGGVQHGLDIRRAGGVDLVHHQHVGHAEVGLAGVVRRLVAGTVRVDDGDGQVGPEEREVVVAAVPQDDVGFALSLLQDLAVVDAGVDHVAAVDVRFVLLALLDGAAVLL